MRLLLAALIALAASPLVLPAGTAAANPPPKEQKADAVDPLAKKITGSDAYVPMFGLRATLTRNFNLQGVLAVDAGLDVPEAKVRKQVAAIMPRLRSSMREAVQNYAALSYLSGHRPNADMLVARLQKAVDHELGKGVATVTLASVIVFSDD